MDQVVEQDFEHSATQAIAHDGGYQHLNDAGA